MNKIAGGLFVALVIAAVGIRSLVADSTSSGNDLVLIKEGIQKVKSESDSLVRERSAAKLVRDIQSTNQSSIDEATVDALIALLHDDSDAVRNRVAMAIAATGPVARKAAPALEDALELSKQYMLYIQRRNFMYGGFEIFTGTSSADAICMAFKAIGPPSPPDCFDGWFGEPVIEVPWTKTDGGYRSP